MLLRSWLVSQTSGIARYSWRTWSGWTPRIYGEFSSLVHVFNTHLQNHLKVYQSAVPEAEYLIRKHKNDDKISVYLKIHSCLQGRQPPDPRAEITYRTCQFYYLQYLHLENKNKLNPYSILFFILLNLLHFAYKSGHKLLNFHHLFLAHQLFNIRLKNDCS